MALIACPDCGRSVSDQARSCIGCGRPLAEGVAVPAETVPPLPKTNFGICENCGSADLQPLPMIHAAGTSYGRTTTRLIGAGVGDDLIVGGGTASTSSTSRSLLAAKAAPPNPEVGNDGLWHMFGCVTMVLLFFLMAVIAASGAIVLWVPLVGGFLVAWLGTEASQRRADERNKQVYKPAYARWERTLMCLRCGEMREPKDA